jgi:hypothetical protein
MSTPQQGAVARLPLGSADIAAAGAVRRGISGEGKVVDGPGPSGVTSADYTRSRRSLDFIENFIRAAAPETDIPGHSASNYLIAKDIRPSPVGGVWDLGPLRPLRMTLPPSGRPGESQMYGLVT